MHLSENTLYRLIEEVQLRHQQDQHASGLLNVLRDSVGCEEYLAMVEKAADAHAHYEAAKRLLNTYREAQSQVK